MNTQKFFAFLFVLGSFLFASAALLPTPLYAQAEVDSVTKHFSLPVARSGTTVNAASSETCDVMATLNLYRNQRVQVIYEWSNCSSAVAVDWEIVSIQNASGQFTTFNDHGSKYPYNQIWTALKAGDRVALHTHINGVDLGEIATHYTGKPPVWVKIDTRSDLANRQCFQFIGETDPWATFSAGDKSYTRHLSSAQWTTDWLEGPNQPTVNWHAKFYKDEAMTELINQYEFNNVANPCYQPPTVCQSVSAAPLNGAEIKKEGENVQVTVNALNASQYRILGPNGEVIVAPSSSNTLSFLAKPTMRYQIEVLGSGKDAAWVSSDACQLEYKTPPPPPSAVCQSLDASPVNRATIQKEGQTVKVTIKALHATQYRISGPNDEIVAESRDSNTFSFFAKPGILYRFEVIGSGEHSQWVSSEDCELFYSKVDEPETVSACLSIESSIAPNSAIPAEGIEVEVTCHALNATLYRIVDENGVGITSPSSDRTMHFHAMPNVTYHVEVADQKFRWRREGDQNCSLRFVTAAVQCSLEASHYGDPIGKSRITTWVVDEQQIRQISQLSINKVVINWDNVATVSYPTASQPGPWQTNQAFELVSEPEVMDVGFGRYTYEAWVYVQGFTEPAYCTATGHAQDHDNLIPDPGPFAKANPEGKFQRSSEPSRLPSVGQLPFDGGNGSNKVELILWAFEKQGHGTSAKITAIANEGKPIARLGMESVSNYVKFDGIPAREGIVYGFQIGEHGPWSPLFCPAPDSNPTTITVFWGAGGQTWLSDYAAYGDCWWLTAAAALNGWVTVDEKVATYNALQPMIDWNGHQNLVFSLAQDKTTGLGPRMQDEVIGLQACEWQGDLIPADRPQDFEQRIAEFQAK